MAFPEPQRIPGPASLCEGVCVFVWDCGGDNQQWQEGRSVQPSQSGTPSWSVSAQGPPAVPPTRRGRLVC